MSQLNPCWRRMKPSPAAEGESADSVFRRPGHPGRRGPWGCCSRGQGHPRVAPPPARARRCSASTLTLFIDDKSMTICHRRTWRTRLGFVAAGAEPPSAAPTGPANPHGGGNLLGRSGPGRSRPAVAGFAPFQTRAVAASNACRPPGRRRSPDTIGASAATPTHDRFQEDPVVCCVGHGHPPWSEFPRGAGADMQAIAAPRQVLSVCPADARALHCARRFYRDP